MKGHRPPPAALRLWLAEPLPADVADVLWHLRRLRDVVQVAVMPDVHLAHEVCIGTVLATHQLLYPAAVGGDIGCGMAAVALDCPAARVDGAAAASDLIQELQIAVPIIRRHEPSRLGWLSTTHLSDPALERKKDHDGRIELGTLGRGNHFLEFQEDLADGRLWLMVHSGSRCMGQVIRHHHLARAEGSCMGMRYLPADGPAGRAYLQDAGWARAYAAINRRIIINAALALLQERFAVAAIPGSYFQCDHNHVLRCCVGRRLLWVHRKGAMHASAGRPGIIPGSMGTLSYHVRGRGCPHALYSSSHGAGRAMTRERARQQINRESLLEQMGTVWFDRRAAHRLTEEAPHAYKDIAAVMRAQRELTTIVRVLRPVLSFKGT